MIVFTELKSIITERGDGFRPILDNDQKHPNMDTSLLLYFVYNLLFNSSVHTTELQINSKTLHKGLIF